jgi:hypothetical protein
VVSNPTVLSEIQTLTSLTKSNVDESRYDESGEPLRRGSVVPAGGTRSLGCSPSALLLID